MNQPRELLFVALVIEFSFVGAANQLFAQVPCETGQLLEADLEDGAHFGRAVAIDGDTAIVGASHVNIPFFDPGAAFVYRFDGSDWLLQQELLSFDGVDGDQFGDEVALDGDTVVVGAKGDDPGFQTGSAYIFRFDGKTWFEQQKLFKPDGESFDSFGESVAVTGETVFVGASGDNANSGATYVYTFDGARATWVLQQVLHPSDADQGLGRRFGRTVAIDGGAAVIGATDDNELGTKAGAVYVFRFDGSNWIEEQKLLPSKGIADDRFGISVSLSTDVAVIGTRISESAYIFNFDGASWNQEQILVASDGNPSQDFGRSVAISGDVVAVGAGDDDANGMDSGSAYVFRFDGKSWLEEEKLLPVDGEPGDHFGLAVAISGETALIGAPYDDNLGFVIGSAYVFTGLSGIDCNLNLSADSCDIWGGSSRDENGNGVPDECEGIPCPWDCDGGESTDGTVGIVDFLALLAQWGGPGTCDFDGGGVGITDFLALLANWGPCP